MLRPGRGGGLPQSYGGGYSSPDLGGYGGTNNGSTYGGYSSSYKDKPRRSSNQTIVMQYLKQPIIWLALAAFVLFLTTMQYRGQRNWILRQLNVKTHKDAVNIVEDLREQIRKLQRERVTAHQDTTAKNTKTDQEYAALERENRKLQKERDELRVKYESPEKRTEATRIAAREDAWKKQVHLLQQAASRESRRATTEKFGPGPHHVQISVLLHYDATPRSFVLEMAPLDSVPHAVQLFLEQVDHGLWNDAWIYLNGPHVLQFGPQAEPEEDGHEEEDAITIRNFRELQLETLAFPEYSEDYRHIPWSVGFTGRPGGPDWYINKVDNSIAHGPGGQFQHDLDEYADPCFAKVIDGFEVLKEIFAIKTSEEEDWEWFFDEPIHIINATILEPLVIQKIVSNETIHGLPEAKQHQKEEVEHKKKFKRKMRPPIDHQVEP